MAIIVVNGEPDWAPYFTGFEVEPIRIQDAGWVLRGGELWCLTSSSATLVEGVLWRLGAVRQDWRQRAALNAIRLASVPCVSSSTSLLRCWDRIAMLAELREAGIPTVEFDLAIGDRLVKRHGREFPFIVKVGSHHGGFSKALIEDGTQWSQIADLLFCADDFMTVEPYVEHERDLRCLMIGDQAWCMEQRGASWRANADTLQAKIVEPPTELLDYTQRIRTHLGATSVGVDALERADGSFVVLEVNDPPGLVGFPEEARRAVAAELLAQLRA